MIILMHLLPLVSSLSNDQYNWVIDSGASRHMT